MKVQSIEVLIFGSGLLAVTFGLFSLFAILFVGGIGGAFFNFSFVISSVFLVVSGVLAFKKSTYISARYFCLFFVLFRVPVIYLNINGFDYIALPAIAFDVFCILIVLPIMLWSRPNHVLKRTG